MDFSAYMTSTESWVILFLSATLIGMSKTGIQGISMLAIPLLAVSFGAKPSTGLILPMLCAADIMAVLYYKRIAEWRYIIRLLPSAIVGFFVAIIVDKFISPTEFKQLMGLCLLFVMIVMLWTEFSKQENKLVSKWWYSPVFGVLGGFTTMMGNAAGPVMAIYLLSVKLPKYSFVGTNAWFFLVVNYLKLPLQIFVWDNISVTSLMIDLYALPFIIIGAVAGIWLVKKLPEKWYRRITIIATVISVIILIF